MTTQSPDYRAGLEAAAGICRERIEYYVEEGCGCELNALESCIDLFGAAIEQSQPQVQRECCAPDCEWIGFTDRMLGSIGPLCPDCGEVTEPTGLESQPQEVQPVAPKKKSMDDLLPCPFCGDKIGVHVRQPNRHIGQKWWTVDCEDCGADSGQASDKQAAIDFWNRRPATNPYTPKALTAAGFASVEDLLAAAPAPENKS